MLRSIHIRNIALIDDQTIEFDDGFSVLTGETGAGKSIIIESFNFVLGERANRDLIKYGAEKASVEAEFDLFDEEPVWEVLKELELEPEDSTLILYRDINATGKGTSRVNGVPVSVSVLKQIGDELVDIHGQHAHQSLLNPKMHLVLLDAFAGQEATDFLNKTEEAYKNYNTAKRALNESDISERERAQKCDLYAYQINEINQANLVDGEEEQLTEERSKLSHAQLIMESLGMSSQTVSGENGILSQLSAVQHQLEGIASFSAEYKELSDRINEDYYSLEDAAYTLRNLKDAFSYDPDSLNQIEWRLEQIAQLKRKYGSSIHEILEYREKVSREYEALQTIEERKEQLKAEYEKALSEYLSFADRLSAIRKQASEKLSAQLLPELSDLGMPHASFEVNLERLPGEAPSAKGYDSVEFLLSANKGEPVKPLTHVASGGEISRIMLAFKTVLAATDGIPTMVFDEIDSGVSGQMGTALAEKMREIAGRHQVLCITHLAQIAAYAHTNYLVEKETVGNRTISHAVKLNPDQKAGEIARIMSGNAEDETALAHARMLIETASSR